MTLLTEVLLDEDELLRSNHFAYDIEPAPVNDAHPLCTACGRSNEGPWSECHDCPVRAQG